MGHVTIYRFASHRLSGIFGGIVAFATAGLVMICAHDARIGDALAAEAHAEEMAPLVAINELVKHKGLAVAPERACGGFAVRGSFDREKFAEEFTMVGVTVGRGDLAKINPKYPKDYDASFVALVDRHPHSTKVGEISDLVLRTTNVILCRTSRKNIPGYAFSVVPEGQIVEAAVGGRVGNAYRWSVVARDVGVIALGKERPNEMTAEMQDIFSIELQLWSGAAVRQFVEELPNKR